MSQTFEESPLSDSKMDISVSSVIESDSGTVDVTTSIISNEGNKLNIKNSLTEGAEINSTDIITGSTDNTEQCSGNSSPDQIWKLDNQRLLDNESSRMIRLEQCNKSQTNHRHDHQQPQHQNVNMLRSELTIANSHPLMSPPGTDSDSENGHRHVFSYPDVIPESEPLRIAAVSTGNSSPQLNRLGNKLMNHNLDVTLVCPSNQRRKISVLREPSPDLISSGSEQDLSQYQATVEPNYQSVALISNNLHRSFNKTPSPKPLSRRKIPVPAELLSDDMSSLDSISNHSFDDDLDHNLASLSPSSSVMDGINDKDEDFADLETPTNMPPDPIPQYTAEDERRDSRNWQKITLPDGKTREIDMKVIEPYKRVLSHGGYLKAGGHNAVVLFCACHLPDRSRTDYHYVMDNLFLYVVKTLEQLVTEDYVLVYLHGGSSRRNVPPFPWLKKCYQLLDRRLRKSLKNLYLVHPTFWLKSVVWMSRPFVSSKFWRKLIYVRSLEELYSLVPVEKASIPDKVKNYDSKYT